MLVSGSGDGNFNNFICVMFVVYDSLPICPTRLLFDIRKCTGYCMYGNVYKEVYGCAHEYCDR